MEEALVKWMGVGGSNAKGALMVVGDTQSTPQQQEGHHFFVLLRPSRLRRTWGMTKVPASNKTREFLHV